jgi:uncharacterized protein (TIGR03790 family)
MSLLPENIIVVYRQGDADSLDFAEYYATKHNIAYHQLIPIPCSSNEILSSYANFQSEVEIPLLHALSNEYLIASVKAIVIGYNVPGGFIDGSNIIATGSRLANINNNYSKQTPNPIYNRQIYSDYSFADSDLAMIVSRIDAPTLAIAKSIVDSGVIATRQGRVNGKFFFDNDAITNNSQEVAYHQEMSEFETLVLPTFDIIVEKTFHWDEYTDVPLFRLSQDSFMWAWKSDRAGYSFFQDSRPIRAFLYNADTDGAGAVRNIDDKRWPLLALSSGYAATAGAMSDPTASGYLRPSPFFESILRGTTIGEAFIYSLPYLDWTVCLFGDPLTKVNLATSVVPSNIISITSAFNKIKDNLANAMGYYVARANTLVSIRNQIFGLKDFTTSTALGQPLLLAITKAQQMSSVFQSSVNALFKFAAPQQTIDNFLSSNNIQISSLIANATNAVVSTANQEVSGSWFVDGVVSQTSTLFFTYQFFIDIAYDSAFTTIFESSASNIDGLRWFYEKTQDAFVLIPSSGVTSSYVGRRIRYNGHLSLPTGTIFYARIRQQNNLNAFTPYQIIRGVVGT